MQLMSFFSQAMNYIAANTAQLPATHKLMYRGVSYHMPQPRMNSAETSAMVAPLMGKRLLYRGASYEIGSTLPTAKAEPTKVYRLTYRGTSYLKTL